MPREPHPVFDRDIPLDVGIWRYFDFPKFTALLQQRTLYFSRADLLGDPLEGSSTYAAAVRKDEMLRNPPNGKTREEMEDVFRHNEQITAKHPREAYVNCWHLGDHESMAMWQGYGGGPYGVAVRSTFGKLDTALPLTFHGRWREETIYVGRVTYLDYTSGTDLLPHEHNVYGRFMCKSVPYRHENELRAIFLDSSAFFAEAPPPGHNIPVELNDLITDVVVSPLAPPWFSQVVSRLCSMCDVTAPIKLSVSSGTPIYY